MGLIIYICNKYFGRVQNGHLKRIDFEQFLLLGRCGGLERTDF